MEGILDGEPEDSLDALVEEDEKGFMQRHPWFGPGTTLATVLTVFLGGAYFIGWDKDIAEFVEDVENYLSDSKLGTKLDISKLRQNCQSPAYLAREFGSFSEKERKNQCQDLAWKQSCDNFVQNEKYDASRGSFRSLSLFYDTSNLTAKTDTEIIIGEKLSTGTCLSR
ncbi:hypothetical protein ISS07_00400 [Candidatus Woesearchaeota archaeon]|nr:hypothetical protein [Candidatus Woesearchaeota archaeon]